LQELSGAAFLLGAAGKLFGPDFDLFTFKEYLATFLKDAEATADPVERMMLEQMALSHYAIGGLHVRGSACERPDEVIAFLTAAARLQAEFRRSALALQAYREAAQGKRSEDIPQRPARTEDPARGKNGASRKTLKVFHDSELGSNHNRVKEYFHEPEPALI
jgi:hypothetical protein